MVEPMIEKNMILKEDGNSNTVLVVAEEEDQKNELSHNVNVKEMAKAEHGRQTSIACSVGSNSLRVGSHSERFRTFNRRSSMENFGQFGLLTPALALCPLADGADALTKQFGDLQGEHRELKLAAAHIEDALTGRGSYGKARSYFKPWVARRCFDILNNTWFQRLMICNILMHSFVIFFEPPSVEVMSVNPVVFVINLFCILLYLFDLGVQITFLTWPVFWSRKAEAGAWNGVQFIFICLFILDCLTLLISRLTNKYLPQCFRCLRPAVILYKLRNIRHIFNVLIALVAKLGKLFFIIFVFILVSACVCVHVFLDKYNCNGPLGNSNSTTKHHGNKVPCFITNKEKSYLGAFNNVALAMLRLFVLLSTENYPEIMIPSMKSHPSYFFFFGIYVFVGVFFLTAILLAIVVDNYWDSSKKHVKKERATERAQLAKAWNLLDPLGKGALSVTDEKFIQLFNILKPKNSAVQNLYLIELLDSNEDGEIDSFEWTTMLNEVLSCEFEDEIVYTQEDLEDRNKWFDMLRQYAKSVTESLVFAKFILVLLIIHCFLFTLKWKDEPPAVEITVQALKTIIVTVFVTEVTLRVAVLGMRILEPLELMDLLLVIVAFCSNVVWYVNYPRFFWFRDYTTVISCLAVFCRLPFNSSQLKNAIEIFISVAPVMVDLMCLLGIILYLLSTVGMELFHTETFDGYMYLPVCGLGFNNFWCSCLILFQLLTTSNWHEIMNQTIDAKKNPWYSLYFVLCFILVNMIVMNLFVAIAIEAFNKLVLVTDYDQGRPPLTRNTSELPPTPQPLLQEKYSMKEQAVQMLNELGSSILGSARAEQAAGRETRRKSLTFTGQSALRRGSRRGSQLLRLPSNSSLESKDDLGGIDEESKEEEDSGSNDVSNLGKGDKRERMLKNRMKRKKRKKKKKEGKDVLNKAEHKVRVVTAFRANKENDLDLSVGDEVTVLIKKDDWWKGKCKNKTGWFPASHVILRTLKAIPAYNENRELTKRENARDEDANKSQMYDKTSENTSINPPQLQSVESSPLFYNTSVPETPPLFKSRVKIKKTGDWRREILGEMTVMNAEELRELNSIMRAELRTPTGLRPRKTTRLSNLDENISFFEEQEHGDIGQGFRPSTSHRPLSSPRFARNAIGPMGHLRKVSGSSIAPVGHLRTESANCMVSVGHLHTENVISVGSLGRPRTESTSSMELPAGHLRTNSTSSVDSLPGRTSCSSNLGDNSKGGNVNSLSTKSSQMPSQQVPIVEFVCPGTPTVRGDRPNTPNPALLNVTNTPAPPSSKTKKKQKNKAGEMPDWMVHFVTSKNLTVGEDVKLDDIPNSSRRSSISMATGTSGEGSMEAKLKVKPKKSPRPKRPSSEAANLRSPSSRGEKDDQAKKNITRQGGSSNVSSDVHRKSVV